ncbi:MAG: hypothetical protein AB7I48_20765 [Planctomycetaceae bacterium]
MADDPDPDITITGSITDDAIRALARLLLAADAEDEDVLTRRVAATADAAGRDYRLLHCEATLTAGYIATPHARPRM